MVNSGSFDSADGNRNGKTRCTQAGEAALGSQSSSDADDEACKSGALKSADGDLPSQQSAIEPTPTKTTEINGPQQQQRLSTQAGFPAVDLVEDGAKQTRKLLCLYCERSFVSANLLQKHVERVHLVKSTRRVSARRQNTLSTTPCSHCDKLNANGHTLNDLFQHLVREHSAKYFGCLFCKERFRSSSSLSDHNIAQHFTEAPGLLKEPELIPRENEVSTKLTRSKVRNKPEEPLDVEENCGVSKRKKDTKLKELRTKKIAVKTSKIALKRSKRLQQQASEHEAQKKRRDRKSHYETSSSNKSLEKSKALCVNPYPEFDSYFRVKKITDHSIDNLKISSLTFDDVFDKAFFNRIKCNIEENLLNHIDGKLFKNEESENRISNFEKISSITQEVQSSSADNYGCDISLNAITPAPSLSLNSQFGEDFELQIEYGSKPSKKRPQVKSDEVHYKYFTRRKYQASILQQKENRDLSKLDMWTQMVVKDRQEKVINKQKNAKQIQEYVSCQEYISKAKREELNKILDRRGPFEDLKEEASKKAAFDKLNSSSGSDVSQEVFTDVREVVNDLLNRVYDAVKDDKDASDSSCIELDQRPIPEHLNLRRQTSSTQEEIDQSDKIALICSSQETENFELPTNTVRAKNELVELTGEWARSRMYICAACGGKFSNMKYMLEHKSLYHPNVWVQHYEFVGNQGELYRHLSIPGLGLMGVVEETIPCKQWKRSDARACTKCGKRCNNLGELHRHVLECGGDWTWMLARKKCKYRPFGTKSRRKRRGFEPKMQNKRKTEPSEKKTYKKPVEGPRQRPSDADTIQRMLANLPAKRSRRCIMSLSDVVFKSRKAEKRSANQPAAKSSKTIHNKQQADSGKTKGNQQRTNRALRSFNKVLSSRILDLSSSLMVKRKLKVLRNQRLSRNLAQSNEEVSEDGPPMDNEGEESSKKRKPAKKSLEGFKSPPDVKRTKSTKQLLAGRLNLKNFFPVKKKLVNAGKKTPQLDEDVSSDKPLDSFEQLKKNKKGGLKGFVRALSLRKRNTKDQEESEPTKKTWRLQPNETPSESKEETSKEPSPSREVNSKKRKLQRSFRNVLNKVKKLKTEKPKPENQPFLEEAPLQEDVEQVKVVTPAKLKDDSQDQEDFAPTAAKENPAIPETFFKLENQEEKSMQAKGNESFEGKLEQSDLKPESTALKIDTTVTPKCDPMISPSPKCKIRKPSRGLNDCIAMLTSKLHQKEDKMSSSLESLFSTSSVTSTEPRPESRFMLDSFPVPATVSRPKTLSPTVEETALDLSKKCCSTPNLTRIGEPSIEYFQPNLYGPSRTSVDDIIQQVVLNKLAAPASRSQLDDTIDSVVHSSLDWFEDKQQRRPKKPRRKKHDDSLITNIIFGKDKLIIAPFSDMENPLIAKIKQNEYLLARMNAESKADRTIEDSEKTEALQHLDEVIQHVSTASYEETATVSLPVESQPLEKFHLAPAVLETNLDHQLAIQEISEEHIASVANASSKEQPEMCSANEPTILENKAIVQSSDSEDEIPLAVIAKLDESQPVVDQEVSDPNESSCLLSSPDFLSEAKDVDALTTDSLKENIEEAENNASNEKVANENLKRKRRKKVLNNKKRSSRKSSLSKPTAFTSLAVEPAATDEIQFSETVKEFPVKSPHAEDALKLSQRTRRKSKSSRKIEPMENDLFKNFSLVINKKTKRIPPTSIVDDSVCDDLSDSDFFSKPNNSKGEDSSSEAPLNDSVEEMDMEIEDIPISSNIIERNKDIADGVTFEPPLGLVAAGTKIPCSVSTEEFLQKEMFAIASEEPKDVTSKAEETQSNQEANVPVRNELAQFNHGKKSRRSKARKVAARARTESRQSNKFNCLKLISSNEEPLAGLILDETKPDPPDNALQPIISTINLQPVENNGSISQLKETLSDLALLTSRADVSLCETLKEHEEITLAEPKEPVLANTQPAKNLEEKPGTNGTAFEMAKIADLNRIEKLMEDSDFVDRLIESKKALISEDADLWSNIQAFQQQAASEKFAELADNEQTKFQPLTESNVLTEIINTKDKSGRRSKPLEKPTLVVVSEKSIEGEKWDDAEFSGASEANLDEINMKFAVDKPKENLQEPEKGQVLPVELPEVPFCDEASTKSRRPRKVINYNEDSLEKRAMETLQLADLKKSPTKKSRKCRKSAESLEVDLPDSVITDSVKKSQAPLLEPACKAGDPGWKNHEETEAASEINSETAPITFKAVDFLEIPKLVVDIHHFDQIDHNLAFPSSGFENDNIQDPNLIITGSELSSSNKPEINDALLNVTESSDALSSEAPVSNLDTPLAKVLISVDEFGSQSTDAKSFEKSDFGSKTTIDEPCDSSSVEYEINSAPSDRVENSPLLIKFNRRCRKNVNYNEEALLNHVEYPVKPAKRKCRSKSATVSGGLSLLPVAKNAEDSAVTSEGVAAQEQPLQTIDDYTGATAAAEALHSCSPKVNEAVSLQEDPNELQGCAVVTENPPLLENSQNVEDHMELEAALVAKDVFEFEDSGDEADGFEINQNHLIKRSAGKDVEEALTVLEKSPREKYPKVKRGERQLKKVKKNNMDIDVANILASDRRPPRKSKAISKIAEDSELGIEAASCDQDKSLPVLQRVEDFPSLRTLNEDTADKSSDINEEPDYNLPRGVEEPMEDVVLEQKSLPPTEQQLDAQRPDVPESERQIQLAQLNIKDLLFSSHAVPDSAYEPESGSSDQAGRTDKAKSKKKSKKSKHSKLQLFNSNNKPKKKSLLGKSLSITALKNVLNTFTKSSHSTNDILPLSEMISSSEMDIAPVLDEIDKSLECDDVYDFIEEDLKNRKSSKSRPRRAEPEGARPGKTKAKPTKSRECEEQNSTKDQKTNMLLLDEQVNDILNTPMGQYESNLLNELEVINNSLTSMSKERPSANGAVEADQAPELKEPTEQPEDQANEGLELRRSRRESRKVASYNENDLIDPIIDALESRRNRSARREKNPVKNDTAPQDKPKLSSEELFDLLKKSAVENESAIAPKPINSFLEDVNENSSNGAFQGISDEDDEDDYSVHTAATASSQNADKIYEFTEDTPENIKDLLGKSKKKVNLTPEAAQVDNGPCQTVLEKPNYCDICKKSFIRVENLIKHKTTLTHISKLSEIEAKEAEEKAKSVKQAEPREEINISDILQPSERTQIGFQGESPSLHNSHSLKLVDIISDVLNKPAMETYSADKQFNKESMDIRKYKSVGERKSFESDTLFSPSQYVPPTLSQTIILENQINLLENIIGNNLEHISTNKTSNFVEDLSSCSNGSHLEQAHQQNAPINSDSTDFVKPTQYEEISEDSTNGKVFEQRKTLNRDEELFLECCSLLKSGSEVSNSNFAKRMEKPIDEPVILEEKKLLQPAEEAHEYSANSRTPTPLGDTYDDEASNSNTISSNWHLKSEKPLDKNRSFSFGEVKSKEASGMSFGEMLTKGLRNQFEGFTKEFDRSNDSFAETFAQNQLSMEERREDSDSSSTSRKIATKGARKVYEGLKVSIPTDDLNLDLLNTSKRSEFNSVAPAEDKVEQQSPSKPRSTRKSKPVKKSQVGSKLLFKVNKALCSSVPKEQEKLRLIDETLDSANVSESAYDFPKTPSERNTNEESHLGSDNDSSGYPDFIQEDVKSISSSSSVSTKQPEVAPENITKKKYQIMGKIFKNAAKSKMEDIDEDLRNIPEIPEMDNLELVENYVRSCQRVQSPYLPLPPPPPLEELPKKPKMSEEEMNILFDRLVGKETNETKPEKTPKSQKPKPSEPKKRNGKVKSRKRGRCNSGSSDDEFNISRTTKKRSNRKNNQEDSGINLELELKECIGVASRKSQRTCTSGKQNILLEYWSSDEEAFEAMLESHKIPVHNQEEKRKASEAAKLSRKVPVKKKPVPVRKPKPPSSTDSTGTTTASNRRKRAAANPLYHWSSSSEDESQSLIEIKPIREEYDEDDRPVQHGWIVGDSPKKLVTMLALTKGKKTDFDSVKEQGRKRTSNSNS
ncbi:uncharacterized protein LOC109533104 isoform X1 [Dendroctonus ponderosae]|uniref:uncharacterized protein LOC109533104 isoform X1 n=1 Tax=Dendroctonus ponderosae TaxID=77166 RepID=UPI002035E220|nr:uncharacterized protein LOC109533104 isoform X1 [Dendroctonus ponderosae]KAH1024823.1 hypothetical protein HUJ05_004257 [Dendroctonus ponderosae]